MCFKTLPIAVIAIAAFAVAAGCSTQAQSDGLTVGTVVGCVDTELLPVLGAYGLVIDIDGHRRTLHSLYSDATILIVTEEACLTVKSAPVRTSQWFYSNIPIIEVSTPPGGCGDQKQCTALRGSDGKYVVSLCDSGGLVRKLYEVSVPTAVLVLDREGTVRAAGTLDEFEYLRLRAEAIADETPKDNTELRHDAGQLLVRLN